MRNVILTVFLISALILIGCSGQSQTTGSSEPEQQSQNDQTVVTHEEDSSEPTSSPEEPVLLTNDNDKIQDMLEDKLNDQLVRVSGTVFVSGNEDGITTIQIYPDPDDEKLVVTAYFETIIDTGIKIGDKVIIEGLSKGKLEVPGDVKVIGMLAKSAEKIE